MNSNEVRAVIEKHAPQLREAFSVARLDIFGSVARGELTENSDVDFLVEFDGPYRYRQLLDLADFLEGLVQRRVDLVTSQGLRPRIRTRIAQEAIRVA